MKEIIEKLKKHYDYKESKFGRITFKNHNALLDIDEDVMMFIFDDIEESTDDPKYYNDLVLFFEQPFHAIERVSIRKQNLTSYIYKQLENLTKEGYHLLINGDLWISFIKDNQKLTYSTNFFTGEIVKSPNN